MHTTCDISSGDAGNIKEMHHPCENRILETVSTNTEQKENPDDARAVVITVATAHAAKDSMSATATTATATQKD